MEITKVPIEGCWYEEFRIRRVPPCSSGFLCRPLVTERRFIMRKFLTKAIPLVTLALFICIMLSGGILKKPFGKKDDVPQAIANIIQDIDHDNWNEANKDIENLEKAWKKVIRRIQFSSERDEINYVSTSIARLRGAALAEDKANSIIELKEAYHHWKTIGK